MSDWTQVAMFWATFGLVLVTVVATMLNYWLVRSQHDPHVLVYTASDPDRPSVITIVVKNVGRGAAYNVRFASSRPIPWQAWGLNAEGASAAVAMDKGPLVSGIPILAPSESRVMNWGQYGGLEVALEGQPIRVTTTYESRGVLPFNPTEHSTESVLEAESFAGTVAHQLPLVEIRNEMKELRQLLGHLMTGFKKLNVRVSMEEKGEDASGGHGR